MKRYIVSAVRPLSSESLYDQLELIKDPDTSPEMLRELFECRNKMYWSSEYQTCLHLARNPNTPVDILKTLSAKNVDNDIKKAVALNPSTPTDVLWDLYNSCGRICPVLSSIARNPNTPAALLDELSKQHSKSLVMENSLIHVRCFIAENPNTSGGTLSYLSYDDPIVQYAVAGNPNTPFDTLKRLLEETDDRLINRRLEKNPTLLKGLGL